MVNYCVCAGCTNSCLTEHRVHHFPSRKSKAFRLWVRFVQVKRADFTAASVTVHSVICSAHFTPESYRQGDLLESQMGFRSKDHVRLIADAVPAVHLMVSSSKPKDPLETGAGGTGGPSATTASASRNALHRKLSLSRVKPELVSVGTQTERFERQSTPLPSPVQSEDESFPDVTDRFDLSWAPDKEMCSESSDEDNPEEPMQESLNDSNVADKFIVCLSELMCLFTVCSVCCGETQGQIVYQEGTYIKIKQACTACGYQRFWQNQNMLHRNMPACNLLLSGAIHFSGCMATQTIRMLKLFGLQCISASTFFRHQRRYTIPTIVQTWQDQQRRIITELKEIGGGLILSGDCRSDSPGHCAKYGTYSLIEDRINKVLDLQLVQSSEVPNSTWCEIEGLKRSVRFLKDQGMQVSALITDRNRQVAKWVREELRPEGTSHFYDIWHVGKSLQKSIDAAAKEKDCEDLKLWKPAIVNHLYWTAASTPNGDPDVMEAKWQSMLNHVQDVHEHSYPSFPRCEHPPLEGEARDKQWLEPGTTVYRGSTAAIKLESLTSKKTLLKDIRQLSPDHQTFSLEAFHSLILHFAPKHTGFSFLGMYSRLLLAVLHFNENGDRDVSRTNSGEARYAVRYPRFRKGGWVVRPINEKPSYEYASALMVSLREAYMRSPQSLQEDSNILSSAAPAPLSTHHKIAKDEAVGEYLQRHSRFKQ
ncbi:hypothetical protein N1851_028407 [Merluccius polli]|uniref:THAP-type domain-containing protein n=1 Tax=Merluccius polli TaxID=89951 RepID=A0AA47M8T7_MERPO|nr:hypothetical protein N1851_028407 [Merluccius polli]